MDEKELFFDENESWINLDSGIATIGITKESANKVKEFIFINLPKISQVIKKGEVYVSLEAVKWSGHLQSPLSGEVIEINQKVFEEPSLINKSPYEAWIVKLKLSNPQEKTSLLTYTQKKELTKK
ncbi:MAG TPA: glycine cleavage system protein H [Candidatus Woesearchaeota archaeon]|jgi:glycine cleavage system H protein|nr:glycine cleavage system protein H [Candidatus Woesearchaeota archaeon]